MKAVAGFALVPLAILLGCSLAPTTSAVPAGQWQNWQIQAGAAITSPPNTYPSFVGAIQIQGTQASGIFTAIQATGTGTVQSYSGGYSAPTGSIGLVTQGFEFGITEPATPYTPTQIGVIGGCVYPQNTPGPECLAIFTSPSTAVQIADLTGTYSGTLTNTTAPSMSGTATLILTQSSTANSSGAFPLTGTLTFPVSSGLGTVPLSGTVSGEGITLSDPSAAPNSPSIIFAASANPTATQIAISNLTYSGSGTTAKFAGTLIR